MDIYRVNLAHEEAGIATVKSQTWVPWNAQQQV